MKKLKLNLDDLKVESFETIKTQNGNGTIFGAASEERCESAGLCGTGTGGNPSTDPNALQCGGGGGSGVIGYCLSDAGWDCLTGPVAVAVSWAASCLAVTCLGATIGCGCNVSAGADYSHCGNCTHNNLC